VQVGLAKTLSKAAMAFEWVNEVFEHVIGFYNFYRRQDSNGVRTML
jgi:hypothetical protein